MRPVGARPAVDRIQHVEPLEDPHDPSLVGAQRSQSGAADEREYRCEQERERPGDMRDRRREGDWNRDPDARQHRLLEADRGSAAGDAGDLGGRGEREPVPGHADSSGRHHDRDEEPQRPAGQRSGHEHRSRARQPDAPQRDDARAEDIGPPTRADPEHRGEYLRGGECERRLLLGQTMLVVQEQHAEAHDRDLRIHVDPTSEAESPQPSVTQRVGDRGDLDPVTGVARTEDEPTCKRADRRDGSQVEERRLRPARARQGGQCERSDEPAQRNRRLPDSEREAALLGGEPLHHRPPARRLHARAGSADESEQEEQDLERRRVRGDREQDGAAPEADPQSRALAVAVGRQPPREQGHRPPDPRCGEQQPDLADGEPELVLERRCDDGQPEPEDRSRRLRGRPGSEDGPAITHAPPQTMALSAKGLTLRYLKPVSTASVTITASGPRRAARRCAPTTFAPVEIPARTPSSFASRLVISTAASSSIGSTWSTRPGSQCGITKPDHPWMRNGPDSPPPIAADEAGSCPWMKTPCGRSASETPMRELAVPIPWQNAVTRPSVCSQISRPRRSRWSGMTYGLLN